MEITSPYGFGFAMASTNVYYLCVVGLGFHIHQTFDYFKSCLISISVFPVNSSSILF